MTELVVSFILCVELVVLVHCLGHFIASRLLGVNVEAISFGIGRPLFSRQTPIGVIRIGWIPLGGYVSSRVAPEAAGSFARKLLVILAGPAASALFFFVFLYTQLLIHGGFRAEGSYVVYVEPTIVDSFWAMLEIAKWYFNGVFEYLVSFVSENELSEPTISIAVDPTPFTAFLGVATSWLFYLALINALPIPHFDGAKLLDLILFGFLSEEKILTGKRWIKIVVLTLFLAFVIWVTWNDIQRMIGNL